MSMVDSELAGEHGRARANPVAEAAATPATVADPPPAGAGRELAARAIADFLQGREVDLVFFFGYGDGAWAEALRARTAATLLVFEPRPSVAMHATPLPGVTVCTSLGELMAAAAARPDLASCRVLAGAIPALRTDEPTLFARFGAAVRQALIDARIRAVTHQRSASLWLSHLATNLPRVATLPPLDILSDRFAGRPGVVIGAGPSLDRNLPALAALQGRALLCAASTALPALARAGIVPELVVAIEANDLSLHFADVPHLDQVTLLPGAQGHPAHFAQPVGRMLAFAQGGSAAGDWLQRAWGCRPLESGGSVACIAFTALHRLGCDPLVLVGMDLALTEGRTHAAGSEQAARRVRYEPESGRVYHWFTDLPQHDGHWQAEPVTAWGGGTVLTRPVFSSFRLWFEGAAETWARERTLINATEGGARIHGFREVALADWSAVAAPAPLDARALIDRVLAAAPPPDAAALWRELAAELSAVGVAAAAATTAAELADRALRDLQAGRHRTLAVSLGRLAAAEARLGEGTRVTRLLNTLVGERTRALANGDARPPVADRLATTAWSLRQSRRISEAVVAGAAELTALFGPLASRV